MGVESGTDGGTADAERHDPGQGGIDPAEIRIEQGNVAGEFLPEGDRRGVLEMGPANFDDAGEGLGFGVENVAQFSHGREEVVDDDFRRGNGHGRWKGVVRRLRHVDMVVGVHGRFRPHLAPGEFNGAV